MLIQFDNDSDYIEKDVLYGCMIESIDLDRDGGLKLTSKGEALSRKVKK